jgi:hypothetical protein
MYKIVIKSLSLYYIDVLYAIPKLRMGSPKPKFNKWKHLLQNNITNFPFNHNYNFFLPFAVNRFVSLPETSWFNDSCW